MRRKKLFTKSMLDRFGAEGRCEGIKSEYRPWHQVRRSEPSSIGKSGRYLNHGRTVHLLSTVEYYAYLFALMDPTVVDIREQFALQLRAGTHELDSYIGKYGRFYPGTLDIAEQIGIKHPMLRDGSGMSWRMTTDLLVALKIENRYELLAISCKKNPPSTRRTIELLNIEFHYWKSRGVTWLLFTSDLYERVYADTLRAYARYWNPININLQLQKKIIDKVHTERISYIDIIQIFSFFNYSIADIQTAFWSSYWANDIPMRLKVAFNPGKTIEIISKKDFIDKNPIISRRSSWKLA